MKKAPGCWFMAYPAPERKGASRWQPCGGSGRCWHHRSSLGSGEQRGPFGGLALFPSPKHESFRFNRQDT
jgi:hypothetical protein